jgi:hypothetical protein
MPKPTPEYLTEKELSKRLKIAVSTLQAQRSRPGPSSIPWIKLSGRVVRYDWAAVQAWLRARTHAPGEKEGWAVSKDWVGGWYEASEVAAAMKIDLNELLEWVRDDNAEDGLTDLKQAKDENGNPLVLISSRWVHGEEEALRRDLAELERRAEKGWAVTAITFDTHKFVRRLKEAGLPETQAEAIADAFRDAQGEAELATKQDIEMLRRDLRELESRMTIRLGIMLVAAVGVAATLVKLL